MSVTEQKENIVVRDTSATTSSECIDPISLEVIRHSFIAMMDEAEANLARTAFSTIIRDAKDYCVGLVTAKGETIAQSRGSIPTFVADLGSPVLDAISIHGDDIHQGDIIINNYAGICGQHLNNVVMFTPIFDKGKLVAFPALRTHWPDVGGIGLTLDSRDICEEGVQYRAVKLYKQGVLNDDVERIIRYNTRTPDATFGDLEAQVAGCKLIKRRFEELLARYGWDQIEAAIHEMWNQSERYVRRQIRLIPNGRYFAESFLDGDGTSDDPIPIRVTVIVEDEDVTIDFREMPPQAVGPYNSGATGGAASAAKVAFKGVVAPLLPPNEGEFRPLKVLTKPGTIVSASEHAPMAWWANPIKTVIDVILRAFADAIPERISAGNNAERGTLSASVRDPKAGGRWSVETSSRSAAAYTLGGWGGHRDGDGQSAMRSTTHGDTRSRSVEVAESESPMRVLRHELIQDSGGAGRHRGGLATEMEVLLLTDGRVKAIFDRSKYPPWGLFGGKDGAPSCAHIVKPGEQPQQYTKASGVPVPAGTRLIGTNNGGGGYGDPFDRDLCAIERDLAQGYISEEVAIRDYGVVFAADGEIDAAATETHRRLWRNVTPQDCEDCS
jgi:N-methylhydantoinase B